MRSSIVALMVCLGLLGAPWAAADPVTSPDPASADGQAILAPALTDLTTQLGKAAKLKVRSLNVAQGWAFVDAAIQEPDGQPIDYAGTPFAEASANGLKSKSYVALLHNGDSGWSLTTSRVGPTDVAWATWSADYGAPAAIFETS